MQTEVVQHPPQTVKVAGPATPKAKRPPRQGRNNSERSNSERESGKQTPKNPAAAPKPIPKSPKGWAPVNSAPQQQPQQPVPPKSPGKPRSPRSKVSLKTMDMPEEMQRFAVQTAEMSLKRNTIEKNVASDIKKEFDTRYGAPWHCVVGSSFGTFVTHEARHFAFFYVDHLAVLLFKTN